MLNAHAYVSARALAHPHLEPLEARAMMANTAVFTDVDGDLVTVKLTGPGTVTPVLSGGATGFISNLQVADTTEASALSISVKTPSGGLGNGRVRMDALSSVELKSFNAPTTESFGNLTAQLSSITAFVIRYVSAGAVFQLIPPAGRAVAINALIIDGTFNVEGRVSSLRADDLADTASVNSTADIASIRVQNTLGGAINADFFGSIVADFLEGELTARTPNARGYSFGSIRLGSAEGASMLDNDQSAFGRVGSLVTRFDWSGGTIDVAGIDSLRIGDDFRPELMRLRDENPAAFSIRSATIVDEAEGDWRLGSKVGTLRLGQTLDNFDFEAGDAAGHVGSITFLGNQFSEGDWRMASLGSLKSAGPVGGDWLFTGTIPGSNLGLKTATPARLLDGGFEFNAGGLGTLTTQEVNNFDMYAEFFRTISVKPGNQGQGDYIDSFLYAMGATGDGSTNQWSITALSVKGVSDDAGFTTRSSVKAMTFGRFLDVRVFVGSTDPLQGVPAFGDTALLDTSRRIDSFTVKFGFVSGNFAVANGPRVTAGTISKVLINGDTSRADGFAGGFVAGLYGTIKLRSTTGALFTFVPTNLGDNNPFSPTASDFVFRLIVV